MRYEEQREAVASTCRRLRSERLVVGTAGNVSARVGDAVVVSPSGVDYDRLEAAHVGVHRMDGHPVDAPLRASSELPLHLAVYRSTTAGAVVHTHATASTALSCLVDEVPSSHYYTALFGGAIPVAPYATYGSTDLADHAVTALRDRTAALLANHGAVTIGEDLASALERATYLEWVCEVHLRALSTGLPVRTLPDEEIARVRASLTGYGQREAGGDAPDD